MQGCDVAGDVSLTVSPGIVFLDASTLRQAGRKTIRQPGYSEPLAEFVGIFLGDGGFRNSWQVGISFNRRGDHPYAKFIAQLIRDLFGLRVRWQIRERYGSADLVVSSTEFVEFLERIGVPRGAKQVSVRDVPDWIVRNDRFRIACLRGLMDTDGCVYQHRYRIKGKEYAYPKLCFAGTIPAISEFVQSTFQDLGFACYSQQNGERIYVNSLGAVRRYFEIVGTSNPRYLERFRRYITEIPAHGNRRRFL